MNFLTAVSGLSKVLKMLLPQGNGSILVSISPCVFPVGSCLSCIGINGGVIYELEGSEVEDLQTFRKKLEVNLIQ